MGPSKCYNLISGLENWQEEGIRITRKLHSHPPTPDLHINSPLHSEEKKKSLSTGRFVSITLTDGRAYSNGNLLTAAETCGSKGWEGS